MQISIDPRDELPSTLRAVALLLSSIASDRDGGSSVIERTVTVQAGDLSRTVTERGNLGNAATGAGEIPPPPPLIDTANGASDTSTTGTNNSANTSSDSGELDSNNLPWDKRIHSSSKNKNQDGTWRYIRVANADDKPAFEALKKSVEAELRAGSTAPAADAPPPPPPPIIVTGQSDVTTTTSDLTPPPPPPLAEQQADTPSATQVTMQQVFSRANKMPIEQRNMALEAVGLASMTEFLKEYKTRPELAGELNAALSAVSGEE